MLKNNSIKHVIKRCLVHAAAKFGPHTRTHRTPQLVILMYHRILPHDDARAKIEEPGMMVTPDNFKNHLNYIADYFDIVSLSQWIDQKNRGLPIPPKACAITFDDGWTDNYDFAFPILKQLAVPATIFLVSDLIGTNMKFWPERLARTITTIATEHPQYWLSPELDWLRNIVTNYQFSTSAPSREGISHIISCAKSLTDHEIYARLDTIEAMPGMENNEHSAALLNWDQVNEMAASGLIEIGSHTQKHTRLNKGTPDNLLEDEIISSKKHIEQHTGQEAKIFCFPNGDYYPKALSLVKQTYKGAVTTQSGWNTISNENHLLNRISIHQDITIDRVSFLARISGWI